MNAGMQNNLSNIDRKTAILTAFPLFAFGLLISCITIFLVIIGGPSHIQSLEMNYLWHNLAIVISMLALGILIYFAICAIRNCLSVWSYTWLGAILAGLIVSLNLVLDDRTFAFSKFIDTVVVLLVLLSCFIILVTTLFKGWQHTALTSMGICGTLGLSLVFFSVAGSGPFHASLGLTALLIGLIEALILYAFLLEKRNKQRIYFILSLGLINIALAWTVEWVFRSSSPNRDITQFIILAAFLTGLLFIGSMSGLIGSLIQQKILKRKDK